MQATDEQPKSKNIEDLKSSIKDFLDANVEDERCRWDMLTNIAYSIDLSYICYSSGAPLAVDVLWRNLLFSVTELLKPKCFVAGNKIVFDHIFLHSQHSASLVVLCTVFERSSPCYKRDVVLDTLECFMKTDDCIITMLVGQSAPPFSHYKHQWNDLITLIVSLPERVANKMKGIFRPFFELANYYSHLATVIIKTLQRIHNRLEEGHDSSLEFLSHLLGRLSLAGKCDYIFQKLTPTLLKLMHNNFLWIKVAARLLSSIPHQCLESVCVGLLSNIPWYGYVELFFGDSILTKPVLKFLITKKFLLGGYYHITTAQNCLGYLVNSETRRDIFFKTVGSILEVWGDKSSLVHQTQQQHIYLSSLIMISLGYMKNVEIPQQYRDDFNGKLLHGVQNHISHSTQEIRSQGMLIGESFVEVINPDGPKLAFEFDTTPELEKLRSLTTISKEPQDWTETSEELFAEFDQLNLNIPVTDMKNEGHTVEDLDSDDDLEPYDLSNDIPSEREKRPFYLRDCLEGLINNKDSDWTQACLESARNLILSQKTTAQEVSTDIARVLLNLEDTYSIANFVKLRFKALVTICCVCPRETATFLTKEFYDPNYNIRQRLDILEVIATACEQLSSLPKSSTTKTSSSNFPSRTVVPDRSWNEIIKKRLQEKTRIISKGSKAEIRHSENHFGEFAGYFFFPLMHHYDRKENTFDLLGEDHYVLGRLLYTLGIILNSAANCTIFKQMTRTLLEFIWVLRYHTERFVRRALLFALAMIFLNAPPHLLFIDFQVESLESREWLKDVIRQDADEECQKTAVQLLELISKTCVDFYNTKESE